MMMSSSATVVLTLLMILVMTTTTVGDIGGVHTESDGIHAGNDGFLTHNDGCHAKMCTALALLTCHVVTEGRLAAGAFTAHAVHTPPNIRLKIIPISNNPSEYRSCGLSLIGCVERSRCTLSRQIRRLGCRAGSISCGGRYV